MSISFSPGAFATRFPGRVRPVRRRPALCLTLGLTLALGTALCLPVATTAGAADNGPITAITLSSGGLAEVTRRADIDSAGRITMTVPLDQVNDVLKSIVVFDEAGAVEGITLPGPDPLAETFKNLPFSADDLRSPAALLSALQGTDVRLDRAGSSSVEGRVLGVSTRNNGDSGEALIVSVLSGGRIRTVELAADTEIAFLNEDVAAQVARGLAAVGGGKIDGARTVTLKVAGEGAREVAVAYVVPAPIWKTAYRVVTLDRGKARLQAWAVLENASGEDWEDVAVTLSSGAPVTLSQRLHDLYWKRRREVPVDVSEGYVPRMDTGAEPAFEMAEADSMPRARSQVGALAAPAMAAPVKRRFADATVGEAVEGTVTAAFTLPWPVSLASGDTLSAPIVDQDVPAQSVSLYQPDSGMVHPVAAILIENATGTSLPKGILTVYDEQEGYVGDAQIDGMPAGESRMASFATDRKLRVATRTSGDTRIVSLKVVNGVMTAAVSESATTDYSVKSVAGEPRTVIIEHVRRPGWTLTAADLMDETATHHRLKLDVAAGGTAQSSAVEERTLSESYALVSTDAARLLYLARQAPDEATAGKLRALAALQTGITEAERLIGRLRQDKDAETADQERHRANLAASGPGSDLYRRAARKLDQSETRIEEIEREVDSQIARRDDLRGELTEAIKAF